jgi:hypothetical protein
MRNADVENLGASGNKTGVAMLLSAFPSFIKPGTRQTGLTGRFQKSFDMNNWHLLRKGENLGLMTDGKKGVHFFSKGCCENVQV